MGDCFPHTAVARQTVIACNDGEQVIVAVEGFREEQPGGQQREPHWATEERRWAGGEKFAAVEHHGHRRQGRRPAAAAAAAASWQQRAPAAAAAAAAAGDVVVPDGQGACFRTAAFLSRLARRDGAAADSTVERSFKSRRQVVAYPWRCASQRSR